MPRARRRCPRQLPSGGFCRNWTPCPQHPTGWNKERANYKPLPRNWKTKKKLARERDIRLYGFVRCVSCFSTQELEADHVIPRSEGGSDELDNIAWLCHTCHLAKTAADRKKYRK